MSQSVTMSVDMDRACSACGKAGVVNQTGRCIRCLTETTEKIVAHQQQLTEVERRLSMADVEFSAQLKNIKSSLRFDKEGTPQIITPLTIEGDLAAEDIRRLVHLQQHEVGISIAPVQQELPLRSAK